MRNLKLIIEYDGTDFHGWQRQANCRTVQEDLENALSSVLSERICLTGAGRTDAGVHAAGQVANFRTGNPLAVENILLGANSLTGRDVKVLNIEEVSPDFHARFSAGSRRYRYRLMRRFHPLQRHYAWYPDCRWSDEIICEVANLLKGEHSFKSFCRARPGETEYICNVSEVSWEWDADGAEFGIKANRFMHKMVRGIIGALIDLGRGYLDVDEFRRLLEEPEENGATRVAQPQGLTLVKVEY